MLAEPGPPEEPKIVGVLLRLTQTFPTLADSLTPCPPERSFENPGAGCP